MARKIELKAVGVGAVISIVGSMFVTIFVIFWAGFFAASSNRPGLQMDAVFSVRAVGIAVLVIDGLVGLTAGLVAGRLSSAHPIFQGLVVGAIALFVGLLPIVWAEAPWRLLVSDSLVSFASPVFGAKLVEWRRQRRATENVAV
jgi:hypothetical protein